MRCKGITKSKKRCKRKATKNGYCSFHSEQAEKNRKLINFKKITGLLIGVLAALIFIMDVFDFFDLGKPWNDYIKAPVVNYLSEPTFAGEKYNIMLLPFFPDRECKIIDTDYERQIIERFNQLIAKDRLNASIEFFENMDCPNNDLEVLEIGKKKDADLVIWGAYDENCAEENKIRIRYVAVNQTYISESRKVGDTDSQKLQNLEDLRAGYLQKDIDYILYWSLATSEFDKGNYRVALKYSEAFDYDICDVNFFPLVAASYKILEQDKLFENFIKKTSKCGTLLPERYFYEGFLYERYGDHKKAIDAFHKAINLGSSGMHNYAELAEAYSRDGQLECALEYFEIAFMLAGNKYNLYLATTHLEIILKHRTIEENSEFFEEILNQFTQSTAIYRMISMAYLRSGDSVKALEVANKMVENLNSVASYLHRSSVRLNARNFLGALDDINTAISLDPSDPRPYFLRSSIYHQMGKHKEEGQDLDLFLKYYPNNINALYRRAMNYGELNQSQLQKEAIQEIMEKFPNDSLRYLELKRWSVIK